MIKAADASRFVILTTQRSGSSWLEDRLDDHPEIDMRRNEIFRRSLKTPGSYQAYRASSRSRQVVGHILPVLCKYRYLLEVADTARVCSVGFRLMYDQLRSNPSLGLILPAQGYSVIHLVRRNVLASVVSLAAVRRGGVYLRKRPGKDTTTVHLPTDDLISELERRSRAASRHRQLVRACRSIEIAYEDCLTEPDESDRTLLDFLGVDPAVELGSSWVRGTSRALHERIENLSEVQRVLRGTPYEWCLEL